MLSLIICPSNMCGNGNNAGVVRLRDSPRFDDPQKHIHPLNQRKKLCLASHCVSTFDKEWFVFAFHFISPHFFNHGGHCLSGLLSSVETRVTTVIKKFYGIKTRTDLFLHHEISNVYIGSSP